MSESEKAERTRHETRAGLAILWRGGSLTAAERRTAVDFYEMLFDDAIDGGQRSGRERYNERPSPAMVDIWKRAMAAAENAPRCRFPKGCDLPAWVCCVDLCPPHWFLGERLGFAGPEHLDHKAHLAAVV